MSKITKQELNPDLVTEIEGKFDKANLSDSVTSSSSTNAATSKAVKTAMDKANEAKTAADGAQATIDSVGSKVDTIGSNVNTINTNLGSPTSTASKSTSANAHAKLNYILNNLGIGGEGVQPALATVISMGGLGYKMNSYTISADMGADNLINIINSSVSGSIVGIRITNHSITPLNIFPPNGYEMRAYPQNVSSPIQLRSTTGQTLFSTSIQYEWSVITRGHVNSNLIYNSGVYKLFTSAPSFYELAYRYGDGNSKIYRCLLTANEYYIKPDLLNNGKAIDFENGLNLYFKNNITQQASILNDDQDLIGTTDIRAAVTVQLIYK